MSYIVRRDGNAKVLFNKKNGTKIRFSNEAYEKSSFPELVDLKVSNYCPYGCTFCYQGSTRKGKHADLNVALEMLRWLSKAGVFEVAIGGGEPSMWPGFGYFLKTAARLGVKPNFTSFGLNWIADGQLLDIINQTVGGIGVSVHNPRDVVKVHRAQEAAKNCQVLGQHVITTASFEDTRAIISTLDHVLLLGYKTVGFGGEAPPRFSDEQIIELMRAGTKISVDTAFLDTYKPVLLSMGIHENLMASPEGKFSCYLDAVTGTMGASSYGEPETMTPVTNYDEFVNTYRTY